MNELFPVLAGLVGAAAAWFAPRRRVLTPALAAVALGVAATVLTGEYRIGWDFLLDDMTLVAICATAAATVVCRMGRPEPAASEG
jgi:hypothetical protein